MKKFGFLGFLALIVVFANLEAEASDFVYVVEIKGEISASTRSMFEDSLIMAKEDSANALIVMLDTPGGRSDYMMDIIKQVNASPVPVIIYVSPQGAIAASA
ncbi:MAG: nodulation protein NfeD, partial [Candidatus Methanofastidiosia archaeon]